MALPQSFIMRVALLSLILIKILEHYLNLQADHFSLLFKSQSFTFNGTTFGLFVHIDHLIFVEFVFLGRLLVVFHVKIFKKVLAETQFL